MAQKKSKIVVLKEDVSVASFVEVEGGVSSPDVVDAVSTMATEYEPRDNTVQINDELGYFVANFTDEDADKLSKKVGVLCVEEDIDVFADAEEGSFEEGPDSLDMDESMLELDGADQEIDEADPFPEDDDDEIPLTESQINLLTQLEPEIDDLDLDESGSPMDLSPGGLEQTQMAGIPWEKVIRFLKCLFSCLMKEFASGQVQEIPEAKIQEALRIAGLTGEEAARARAMARDHTPRGLWQIYAPYVWRWSTGAGGAVLSFHRTSSKQFGVISMAKPGFLGCCFVAGWWVGFIPFSPVAVASPGNPAGILCWYLLIGDSEPLPVSENPDRSPVYIDPNVGEAIQKGPDEELNVILTCHSLCGPVQSQLEKAGLTDAWQIPELGNIIFGRAGPLDLENIQKVPGIASIEIDSKQQAFIKEDE